MYSEEEYTQRIKELEHLAKDLIMTGRPIDIRKMASKMKAEDAYILGLHVGGLLEIGYHQHGKDIRGILSDVLAEKLDKWGIEG